jgi:hypothetical protein
MKNIEIGLDLTTNKKDYKSIDFEILDFKYFTYEKVDKSKNVSECHCNKSNNTN